MRLLEGVPRHPVPTVDVEQPCGLFGSCTAFKLTAIHKCVYSTPSGRQAGNRAGASRLQCFVQELMTRLVDTWGEPALFLCLGTAYAAFILSAPFEGSGP